MIDWSKYPNFHAQEFESPDKPGSGEKMDEKLLRMLQQSRQKAGRPFVVTSGYRSKSHNASVGGKRNSAHLRGYAVDIACGSSSLRDSILSAVRKVGFHRIGIAHSFIHIDCDPSLPAKVTWVY